VSPVEADVAQLKKTDAAELDAYDETKRIRKRDWPAKAQPSGLDIDEPYERLSQTAQNILDAAWHIVIEEGFAALSFARISELSGENGGSITYHFGNKKGLIMALIDAFVHDANIEVKRSTVDLPLDVRRVGTFFDVARLITTGREYTVCFFELLPATLRNPEMLKQMAELYEGYRDNIRIALGETAQSKTSVSSLARLILGMVDGLSIQYTITPGDPEILNAIQLMNDMVKDYLERQGILSASPPRPQTDSDG
jgi:AcrR family transcriptional regulator